MSRTRQEPKSGRLDLQVTRLLSAPRALVWKAWTDPRQIERWWHPAGFNRPTCERLDLRVGGGFRISMPAEDGAIYTAWGTYREIVPEWRLAYDDRCEKDGKTFHAASLMVTFENVGNDRTRVTIETAIDLAGYADTDWTPPAITEGWTQGWEQNLDGLAALLSGSAAAGRPPDVVQSDTEITLTRTIDAPREAVWRAWTDPRRLAQWWGPEGFTAPVCQIETWPGGRWHIDMHAPNGKVYPCRGRYLEVVELERLVYSDEVDSDETAFGEAPPPNSVHVITFAPVGRNTRLTVTLRLAAPAEREAMANSGAIEGYQSSLDRLDHLLRLSPQQ